jgi:hypothetical protein
MPCSPFFLPCAVSSVLALLACLQNICMLPETNPAFTARRGDGRSGGGRGVAYSRLPESADLAEADVAGAELQPQPERQHQPLQVQSLKQPQQQGQQQQHPQPQAHHELDLHPTSLPDSSGDDEAEALLAAEVVASSSYPAAAVRSDSFVGAAGLPLDVRSHDSVTVQMSAVSTWHAATHHQQHQQQHHQDHQQPRPPGVLSFLQRQRQQLATSWRGVAGGGGFGGGRSGSGLTPLLVGLRTSSSSGFSWSDGGAGVGSPASRGGDVPLGGAAGAGAGGAGEATASGARAVGAAVKPPAAGDGSGSGGRPTGMLNWPGKLLVALAGTWLIT